MKKALKLSLVAVLMLCTFAACTPTEATSPKEIILSADTETIANDGIDTVTFTVTADGAEVSGATITCNYTPLEGNTFTTSTAGEYKFTATYNGLTSNELTVTAGENLGHKLELSVEPKEIYADGITEAKFTVLFDGEAVEATVSEVDGEALAEPVFTTETVGKYEFQASYTLNGKEYTSKKVTVTAIEIPPLTITSSRSLLISDGIDTALFTVMLGKEDVTADATFFQNGTALDGNSFSSTTIGEYQIHAEYTHESWGKMTSAPIIVSTIRMDDVSFDASKPVKKRVAYFTYTATWCAPCYRYKGFMQSLLNDFGDNIVLVNLHTDADDEIGSPATLRATMSQLMTDGRFTVNSWPTSIAELRVNFADPGMIPTEAQARAVYNKYINDSPKTAVMVDSKIVGDKINVLIATGSKEAREYAFGVFLIEDHISEYQNGFGENYDHTNVAREIGVGSIFGDSIGTLGVGDVSYKACSFDIQDQYNTDNLSLVVYTLYEEDGYMVIDNSIKVPVNGITDFNYAE